MKYFLIVMMLFSFNTMANQENDLLTIKSDETLTKDIYYKQ
jgi:hypothetical protein